MNEQMTLRAPLAWLGNGRLVADAAVVVSREEVVFAGPAEDAPEGGPVRQMEGFLMPAAADRHVHMGLADAGSLLSAGVTAVRDLGWPSDDAFAMAENSRLPSFNGPTIVAAGPMLTAPGGYPSQASWAPPGTAMELATVDEAIDAVEVLVALGAGHIKVAMDADAGPTLDDAMLTSIVGCAHEYEVQVTAHIAGAGELERAVGAGVDEAAHTPWTEAISDRVLREAASAMRWVSTLDIHSLGVDTPAVRVALDNLRRFRAHGGTVVYGTDLGNGGIPPRIHVRELMLMREAGMDVDDLLTSMIRAPLEPGAPADVIVLPESPFGNIDVFDEPTLVMRAGEVVRGPGGA